MIYLACTRPGVWTDSRSIEAIKDPFKLRWITVSTSLVRPMLPEMLPIPSHYIGARGWWSVDGGQWQRRSCRDGSHGGSRGDGIFVDVVAGQMSMMQQSRRAALSDQMQLLAIAASLRAKIKH